MPAVQAQDDAVGNSVTQVELVRADDVALRAKSEELALNSVEVVLGIDLVGKDLVQ